jgi:hypothetical protein
MKDRYYRVRWIVIPLVDSTGIDLEALQIIASGLLTAE